MHATINIFISGEPPGGPSHCVLYRVPSSLLGWDNLLHLALSLCDCPASTLSDTLATVADRLVSLVLLCAMTETVSVNVLYGLRRLTGIPV